MAEVMDMAVETLDSRSNDRLSGRRENSPEDSPPPPPPPPPRRRDVDSRNRSPPPPSRGEKERPYRRRSSPSPPPYSHRDRRRSPSRRSPPGPTKRSRRDDGGYDRRRGSPSRRHGYDYSGGHDRGGERPHDRQTYRSSDWPDSRRGSYDDGLNTQREGLMSYKQFIQELEDDVLPAEAESRYLEYRAEYISTQKREYFETHKDEEWLKDKYHPTNLVTVIERRNEHARATAKDFLLNLQSGTLDLGPGLTTTSSSRSGHGSDMNSEDEKDAGDKRRRYVRDPVKEDDLLLAAPKAHPVSAETRRIQTDIEHAQALVRKLDTEKGIEDNVLCSSERDKSNGGSTATIIIIRGLASVKGLEGVELLDTLINYLWRIHGVDYYGMTETNEAKGLRHVRADSKSNVVSNMDGAVWEKRLDSFVQNRLNGQDPLEIMTAKEKIEAAAVDVLEPYVRKIRDEKYGWKYGCGAKGCTKLFHSAEFVHKHLRLKHPELVIELTSKVREDLYCQNYMSDANAPGGTPIMQQSAPRDRAPRRRPNLREERGSRREYDKSDKAIVEDRRDRTDNSPARDTQNSNGGQERGNTDELMFDTYGGQGLHGAAPPPVLMPVPGAGPFGPFVPAPPEVAMRMLREQGGPPPFDGNDGPRSRKGRPDSGPILAVPPAFRQDPRRIRSYQDLDTPEDEVTVIDYRSL